MQKVADNFYEYNYSMEILSIPGAHAEFSTTEIVLGFLCELKLRVIKALSQETLNAPPRVKLRIPTPSNSISSWINN